MSFLDRLLDRRPNSATPSRMRDALVRGRWYRVFSRVDERFVQDARASAEPGQSPQVAAQDAVSSALTTVGFDVRTSTEDPFKLGTWTSIARWSIGSGVAKDPPGVAIFQVQAVEDPPDVVPRVSPDETGLDAGMTPGLVSVVRHALENEHDPRRIDGMARSFDVDYPVSAAVLRNKARVEGYARVNNARVCGRYGSGPNQAYFGAVLHDMGEEARFTLAELERSVSGPALGFRARGGFREHAPVLAVTDGFLGPDEDGEIAFDASLVRQIDADPRDIVLGFGETCRVLSIEPDLASDPNALAAALADCDVRFTPQVVGLAAAAFLPLGAGLSLVRPEVSVPCLPEGPRPVPRGALQLAHALERPEGSLVDMPRELSKEMRELRAAGAAGDPEAVRALYETKRARRLLDRQAWVDHVERTQKAETKQARRSR